MNDAPNDTPENVSITPTQAAALLAGLTYKTTLTLKKSNPEDFQVTAGDKPDDKGLYRGFIFTKDGRPVVSTTAIFTAPENAVHYMNRLFEAARVLNLEPAEQAMQKMVEATNQHVAATYADYHCKKTPKGWKIHVPVKTILEFDDNVGLIVTGISKKQIILHGEKKGLPSGKEVKVFEGTFVVSKCIQKADGYEVRLTPKYGTTINPIPLDK